jgi:hypothetical protein
MQDRIKLLRQVHERWKKKQERCDMGKASKKEICTVCGEERTLRHHRKQWMCSMCINLMICVDNRPEMVAGLLRERHGGKYAAGEELTDRQVEALTEVCDPYKCEELQGAIKEIALALDGGTGTCDWTNMAEQVRRLVESKSPALEETEQHGYYHVPAGYSGLMGVFRMAVEQAAKGKGHVRHATEEPFERQPSMEIARQVGIGYPLGQAVKKIYESQRLPDKAAGHELLGAIVYTAMGCLLLIEQIEGEQAEEVEVADALPDVQYAEGVGHD